MYEIKYTVTGLEHISSTVTFVLFGEIWKQLDTSTGEDYWYVR
jgi:hypothetical protein